MNLINPRSPASTLLWLAEVTALYWPLWPLMKMAACGRRRYGNRAVEIHLLSLSLCYFISPKMRADVNKYLPVHSLIPSLMAKSSQYPQSYSRADVQIGGEGTSPAQSDGWGRNPTLFSVSYSPSRWPTPSPSAVMRRDVAAFLTSMKQGSVATAACWADPRPLGAGPVLENIWGVSDSPSPSSGDRFHEKFLNLKKTSGRKSISAQVSLLISEYICHPQHFMSQQGLSSHVLLGKHL